MDNNSQAKLAQVHPVLANRIVQLASLLTFPILITQGLRTWDEQDKLYQIGRTLPGKKVTDAPAGHSMHNYGLAVDVAPTDGHTIDWNGKDDKWAEILAKATLCRLSEGAKWRTFPDEPHLYPVECPADPDDNMRDIMANKGLQAVWDEVLPLPNSSSQIIP